MVLEDCEVMLRVLASVRLLHGEPEAFVARPTHLVTDDVGDLEHALVEVLCLRVALVAAPIVGLAAPDEPWQLKSDC